MRLPMGCSARNEPRTTKHRSQQRPLYDADAVTLPTYRLRRTSRRSESLRIHQLNSPSFEAGANSTLISCCRHRIKKNLEGSDFSGSILLLSPHNRALSFISITHPPPSSSVQYTQPPLIKDISVLQPGPNFHVQFFGIGVHILTFRKNTQGQETHHGRHISCLRGAR